MSTSPRRILPPLEAAATDLGVSPTFALPPVHSAPTFWPRRWARCRSVAATGPENMAIDLALLRRVGSDGIGVLRTYEWSHPTVSFGRNERVGGAWDVAAMLAAGLQVVRRPTGGRALYHDREVTWSVCLPVPDAVAWRDVYAAVNARLCAALQSIGIPVVQSAGKARADAAAAGDAPAGSGSAGEAMAADATRAGHAHVATACFAEPAEGELVVGADKIAGSAVWRSHGGYLQHGSILLHDAQDVLQPFRLDALVAAGRGASHRSAREVRRSAQVSDWLGPASDAALRDRVQLALEETWRGPGTVWEDFTPSAEELRVRAEARASLVSTAWLWRR